MSETTSASASERAYASIRDRILEGELLPGTMLGEAQLAAEIGVSRTPVRAALARLQDEGWIVIYPQRGALVQGLGERALVELADARLVLESTGAGRLGEDARERLADRLDGSIEAQRAAFADRDVRRFIELTIAFHRSFVEASGNSVLLELNDRLADRQRFVLFASGERLLARCEDIIAEHEDLTRRLRTGDVTGFTATLRLHVSDAYELPVPEHPLETLARDRAR
ncbi:GntR family transcriptional regulator [Microbacterium sp. No. 7]|uniref:GntR family transcriptional regulator n=1 Tax=Microbacterium sp. No. 7 TaxID=1714373 RepID=UPI0006CF9C7C|nr:GntR family transcriptional regulator [Microbacterium sp. No. 7]ALJ21352.1 transcriptional regulator [Microbacterium sp. No. 7]